MGRQWAGLARDGWVASLVQPSPASVPESIVCFIQCLEPGGVDSLSSIPLSNMGVQALVLQQRTGQGCRQHSSSVTPAWHSGQPLPVRQGPLLLSPRPPTQAA